MLCSEHAPGMWDREAWQMVQVSRQARAILRVLTTQFVVCRCPGNGAMYAHISFRSEWQTGLFIHRKILHMCAKAALVLRTDHGVYVSQGDTVLFS